MKTIDNNLFNCNRTGQRISVLLKHTNRLCINNSDKVEKELLRLIKNGVISIFLDLSNIDFIDSTGFQVLLSALIDAKLNNIEFVILNSNKEVLELFKLVKLDSVFDFRNNLNSDYNTLKKVSKD